MKISIGLIIDYFNQLRYDFTSVVIADTYASVSDFRKCDGRVGAGVDEDAEVLFVCTSRCNDARSCEKHIRHIVTLQQPNVSDKGKVTFIVLQHANGDDIMAELHQLFTGYSCWYENLLGMILRKESLQSILNCATAKLTNPIALLDNQMMFLASSGSFNNSVEGTIWEYIGDPSFSLASFYTVEELQKFTKIAHRNSGMPSLHVPAKDPIHTYLSANIWLEGSLVANIGMVDINDVFTDGQIYLVDRIREIIMLYFTNNQQLMKIAEGNLHFVELILAGKEIHTDNVQFYLNRLGWTLDDHYTLCLLSAPVEILTLVEATSYIRLLNQYFPKAMVVLNEKRLVMISRTCDYTFSDPNCLEKLQSLCSEQMMNCGIGSEFKGFMSIEYIYYQAKFALQNCGEIIDQSICIYEDYQMQHIIKTLESTCDLKVYCHPKILELWESGSVHNRELINNLYSYLAHGKNITEAAKESYIHRNTLIYRINKLNEYLGVELSEIGSIEIFYYLISCVIIGSLS